MRGSVVVILMLAMMACSKREFILEEHIIYRIEAEQDTLTGDTLFAVYIPNAFTPNGDGINDLFRPIGIGFDVEDYQLAIFNRWGHLIFLTHDLNDSWGGDSGPIGGAEVVPEGAYAYRIEVRDQLDGSSYTYDGHVLRN